MPFIIDLIWIIGFISIVSISLFINSYIMSFLFNLNFINKYIVYGISVFSFINLYIITCGVLFRLIVPKIKSGHSIVGLSKNYFIWRLNWHFYSYVFLFLNKYVLYNRTIRYFFLRLFRVNVKYSTYFAETVNLQDANNLLTVGKNSGLGSEVIIATHLAISTKVIIFKEVNIGDNTHIQTKVSIAPGVRIGSNSIIGFDTVISLFVHIGDNTRIGARCSIHTSVKIGNNCRIGDKVYIGERITIADNVSIPNNSKILTSNDLEIIN